MLSDLSLVNRCKAPIHILRNRGTVGNLGLLNVCATAEPSGSGLERSANNGRKQD